MPTDNDTLIRIRDIVNRMHYTSERAPDVRAVPMRLVHQEVFDELIAAVTQAEIPVHHRRFACGQITCGEPRANAVDTHIVERVTCQRCIDDLRARRLLPNLDATGGATGIRPSELTQPVRVDRVTVSGPGSVGIDPTSDPGHG